MQKEKEVLRESLDKLNMTKEEINRFEKAFKDPKFQQMFEEYAKEISDPKARAESEAYLRQIESGNQTQNVYGSDVQLIVPEESFVVKTKKEGDEPVKVFINVCTSEKVQKAESKKTVQNGREGNTWSIPFSLGHERATTDKSGNDALVFDFVLHPETCAKCSFPPFKNMVAQTAVENIEKSKGYKLSKSVTYLKMKYKGSEGMDRPGVQAARISAANSGSGPIKPLNVPEDAKELMEAKGNNPAKRSEFSFNRAVVKEKKVAAPKEGEPGYVYESGERVPSFSIVEKGEYDISQMWGDMGKALQGAPKRPKELVFKVSLPEIKSVRDLSLDVTSMEVILSAPKFYKLEAKLPYEVFDKKGRAKFDKKKQTLEVTLPVVPPPKPDPKPFVEPEKAVEEIERVDDVKAKAQECPPIESNDGRLPGDTDQDSPLNEHPEPSEATGSQPHGETENERRWKSLHAKPATSESKTPEGTGTGDDTVSDDDHQEKLRAALQRNEHFVSCEVFRGALKGYVFKTGTEGLGYYKDCKDETDADDKSTATKATRPETEDTVHQKSFIIKPSPSTALWDDLD